MLLKLAILISGRGSNMKSILDAVQKQNIPIKPTISYKPKGVYLRRKLFNSLGFIATTEKEIINCIKFQENT